MKIRYKYDIDGFYQGIERPNSLGIYSTGSTEIEPRWQDGFVPRWDHGLGDWRLVRREDVQVIRVGSEAFREYGRFIGSKLDQHGLMIKEKISFLESGLSGDIQTLGARVDELSRLVNEILVVMIRDAHERSVQHQKTRDLIEHYSVETMLKKIKSIVINKIKGIIRWVVGG